MCTSAHRVCGKKYIGLKHWIILLQRVQSHKYLQQTFAGKCREPTILLIHNTAKVAYARLNPARNQVIFIILAGRLCHRLGPLARRTRQNH